MHKPERRLLLIWLIYTGLVAFGLIVAWDEGLLFALIVTDQSKLCLVIGAIYLAGTGHCALRAARLSSEIDRAAHAEMLVQTHRDDPVRVEDSRVYLAGRTPLPDGFVARFLVDSIRARRNTRAAEDSGDVAEIYAARLKDPHEMGWFGVDAMIKLGLLGTIIGFILMLGSVADVAALDVETMRNVLQAMSAGMKTALYTTLAGLVCGLSLAFQYQLLDRGANELLQRAVHLARVHVLPRGVNG